MENAKLALIIDDDNDLCQMLKAILSGSFESIESASNLKMGRDLLTHGMPDVVFLDNNLPDGQGVSLVKDIKTHYPASKVILITAMDNSREEAMGYGVDFFLEKPLTYNSIHNALSRTITNLRP